MFRKYFLHRKPFRTSRLSLRAVADGHLRRGPSQEGLPGGFRLTSYPISTNTDRQRAISSWGSCWEEIIPLGATAEVAPIIAKIKGSLPWQGGIFIKTP